MLFNPITLYFSLTHPHSKLTHLFPPNSILMTKAKLEKVVLGPEEALATYQKMLKLWKELHEIDVGDE